MYVVRQRYDAGSSSSSTITTTLPHPLTKETYTRESSSSKRHTNTNYLARLYQCIITTIARNIQLVILLVGLGLTVIVQPLFITFMVLLWIGDEAFKSYFLNDIVALLSFSKPTGTLFEYMLKWSTLVFVSAILCLFVGLVAFLKWKDQQNRSLLTIVASTELSNKFKPYFIISLLPIIYFKYS